MPEDRVVSSDDSEFDTVNYNVVKILKSHPEARNSDKILLDMYYQEIERIITNLSKVNITPETITRARRFIQANNKELRPDSEVKELRNDKKKEYSDYYGN